MGGNGGTSGGGTPFGTITQNGRTKLVVMRSKTSQLTGNISRTTMTLSLKNGTEIGGMTYAHHKSTGTFAVRSVQVGVHRQGLAKRMYSHVIQKGKASGGRVFESDKSVSTAASGIWKSLGKTHKLKTNPHTKKGDQLVSDSGGPVFSIDL